MAVSNEISGVQEQNIECASLQLYLIVHFKCAHESEFVFLRNSSKIDNKRIALKMADSHFLQRMMVKNSLSTNLYKVILLLSALKTPRVVQEATIHCSFEGIVKIS